MKMISAERCLWKQEPMFSFVKKIIETWPRKSE